MTRRAVRVCGPSLIPFSRMGWRSRRTTAGFPDAPPAEALAGDAPPTDEPPPEPKKKKKKA